MARKWQEPGALHRLGQPGEVPVDGPLHLEVPFKSIRESFLKIHPQYRTPERRITALSMLSFGVEDGVGVFLDVTVPD